MMMGEGPRTGPVCSLHVDARLGSRAICVVLRTLSRPVLPPQRVIRQCAQEARRPFHVQVRSPVLGPQCPSRAPCNTFRVPCVRNVLSSQTPKVQCAMPSIGPLWPWQS